MSLPRRTIRTAVFEYPIGPVTIEALLAMREDQWGFLRDKINDQRHQKPEDPLARCGRCGGGVFIRVDALHTRRPLFVHFKHPLLKCEWHNESPSVHDARAIQYKGQQESNLHRSLCNNLADLLRADPRCRELTVGTYRPSTEGEHGRYPDVYAELEGLTPVALEVQLSRSFGPEIAGRTLFYGKEKVGLIWVLWGVDPNDSDLPQSFRDIIRRHRGNAFLFDGEAMRESQKAKTLLLWCYWKKTDGSPGKPRLVSMDDLKFPAQGLPYFDDRRSQALLQIGTEARQLWWEAAKEKPDNWYSRHPDRAFYMRAWGSLRTCVPEIRLFRDQLWAEEEHTNGHIAAVILRLLSIIRTAYDGKQRNLATMHSGKSCCVSMLNTSLNSKEYARYGKLIRSLIILTAARKFLSAESLWAKINTACASVPQIEEDHPMWKAARWLFPEALDSLVRHELESLGSLPEWATDT